MESSQGSEEFADRIRIAIELMESTGVKFEAGLTDAEVEHTQQRFDFTFPPDLRAFLQTALPVSAGNPDEIGRFPNWRAGEPKQLRFQIGWPFEGMIFDIEQNVFWPKEWGPRSNRIADAIEIAREHYASAPTLIPVFAHRYIPDDPCEAGNPVMSVHQTDITYYGQNLWDYFEQEFSPHEEDWYAGKRYADWEPSQYKAAHREIRFWGNCVG